VHTLMRLYLKIFKINNIVIIIESIFIVPRYLNPSRTNNVAYIFFTQYSI